MKRFNPNTVKPSTHLMPSDLRNKAHEARVYKAAIDAVFNPYTLEKREAKALKLKPLPRKANHVVKGWGRKGRAVGLSDAKRAMVARRQSERVAFFAELCVEV